ncbi:MAG: hypothetical protein JWR84_3883 [Caulobacter sp.]|nr:hypothetical protein [Caulobacter sp.]
MTVTAPSPRYAAYAGDGGSGPYPLPFRILEAADVRAVVVAADGARAPLEGLVIDGVGDPEGGQATSPRPIAVGETLVLWTDTALVQPADYIAADAFPAETHEAALDRLTLIAQDQRRDLARALSAPPGDTLGPLPDAARRKGMLLTFDAETGDPVTDRDYAGFVAEVVAGLDVGAEVVAAIGASETTALLEINSARVEGLEDIAEAASEGATALGLPAGGIVDIVSIEGGYDEGWAYTDDNGWTTAAYHFSPSGSVGQVVRHKIPGADFSVLPSAYRIFEPPPVLPYDINVIVLSGQSNSEDADSVPMMARTASPMVKMLDAIRPRHFTGTVGLAGFTNAVGAEYVASQSHWGGNMAPAVGDVLEQLIEDVNGKTFAVHGRTVVPVHIGMSSSSYAQIGHGTAHFSTIESWFAAAKTSADAAGKSIGIIAGAWLHGADSYDNSIGQAASETGIDTYWDQVLTYLQTGKLGRTDAFPIGFVGSHAHLRGGNDINPFVAEAEAALIAANPTKYFMVNGEGQFFFDGRRRGFAGSGVHHSAREAATIGAHIGWWVHEVVSLGHSWNSCVPTFARTGAAQVTMSGLPNSGWEWDFYATGLQPTLAQANHGWFFYDPASPSTELALTRPPHAGAGGTLVADFVSALPTNLLVRYGARAAGSTIAGNDIWKPTAPILFAINGEDVPLHRNIPALNKVIP